MNKDGRKGVGRPVIVNIPPPAPEEADKELDETDPEYERVITISKLKAIMEIKDGN